MNIGFDLDKVLISYPPFVPSRLVNRLYKSNNDKALTYRIPAYPEQLFRKATHLPFLRRPIVENLALLRRIPKEGNTFYLISSRYKFLEPETNRIIKRYRLDNIFDGLYFNFENKQPHLFKNEVIKKLKLDRYVDDDLSLLTFVAKHNGKTKFFWLNEENKYGELENNIFAIPKLVDVFQ